MAEDPSRKNPSQSSAAPEAPPEALFGPPGPPGPIQVVWTTAPPTPVDTSARLRDRPRATTAFPPCSDELLALIRTTDGDEITTAFSDYFKFRRHRILGQSGSGANVEELDQKLSDVLDPSLLHCGGDIILSAPQAHEANPGGWPSDCCLCAPCVTLDGARNSGNAFGSGLAGIRRLFIGDVVWLFYFERMGIHQILGVILDAYATTGRLPISNGSLEPGVRDDVAALILEVMVRQVKTGLSSGARDRAALYRTSLGWQSKPGKALGLDTEVNTGFSTLFHRFIYNALEFYKDKRLAVAIQSSVAPVARPSVATLITISNTIDVLKKRFETFDYGRNYYNTLAGIVWTISAMSMIRELRTTLGIPPAYGDVHEFLPAAYDLLVLKRPVTQGEINPYIVHRDCAVNGRDILLDLEVLNHAQNGPGQELESWLTQIEAKVEAYRTAYRNLTGVDLGASPTPEIEQQVAAAT